MGEQLNINSEKNDALVKVSEATKMLYVSSRTIWRMFQEKQLTPVRFRRCTRISLAQVSRFQQNGWWRMRDRIFKPKVSRVYRWRFRQTPKDGKILDISLGTSELRAAEKRRAEMRSEKTTGTRRTNSVQVRD